MSNPIFVSGKVILAGEHAVVYGRQALATSLGLGVTVVIGAGVKTDHNSVVAKAIELAGGKANLGIIIESNLPTGSGLGSSAAVSAAVIKAVRTYLGKPISDDELFQLTFACEKIAHGNPSGIDPAVVVYGGLIAYTKGQPFERLVLKKPIQLLLVNSGTPQESTKEMVELVAQNPDKEEIIKKIGDLTLGMREQLVHGAEIAELLNQNGLLLERLGVVGKRASALSRELRSLGGNVKITGAGGIATGSGMMIVMGGNLAKIKELLDNDQMAYFETEVGVR